MRLSPLCKGARRIINITLPLVFVEIIYIIGFISIRSASDLAAECDAIFLMLEDTVASAVASLGGALFFDFCFKYEEGDK